VSDANVVKLLQPGSFADPLTDQSFAPRPRSAHRTGRAENAC
jgi:hypothetical protein